jgi:hypothetical protein
MDTNIIAMPSVAKAEFEVRNQILKELAAQGGLRLPETRLPEGTKFWDVGEEAKRQLKTEISKLPDASTALTALRQRIALEDIRDIPKVAIQRVRMSGISGAGLYAEGKNETHALGYTRQGLAHFAEYIKPAGVSDFVNNVLAIKDPAIRASVVNYHASRSRAPDTVVLRTHVPDPADGLRVIRAITSSKHSLETGDDLMVVVAMERLLKDAFKGAKLRITRDLNRTDFEVIWPAMERELVVGDIAKIFVRVTNSETKAGSLKVTVGVLRALCANFTTAESIDSNEEDIAIRHIGDLSTKLPQAFVKALSRAEPFVKAFADAYQSDLPAWAPTRGEILERVRKSYQLPEKTVELAGTLWDADGTKGAGDTLAGLVNAMTRASQSETMTKADVTEKAAGNLIARGWSAVA